MTITYHAGRRIQGTNTDRLETVSNRGIITTDGSYTVVTFNSNGHFTPTSAFNVEYLVVAGGGGGGDEGGLRAAVSRVAPHRAVGN